MGGGSQQCAFWKDLFFFCCYGEIFADSRRANGKQIEHNFAGEGFVTGGVFVAGPGKQGVLFQHIEKAPGDTLVKAGRIQEVLDAVEKVGSDAGAALREPLVMQ
mmetsp:Transcript_1456/g.3153  ORF Transcript_1456/g.3153 Transcript_1456/m.3153 type:complete len:104 (+) Transcript_1456:73-384(+)